MLDDLNVIKQRDPKNALGVAVSEADQLEFDAVIENKEAISADIETIVVAGMGGSALAAGMAKSWLNINVPFEIIKNYQLPNYVNEKTLVIASSYSGNTEETLAALKYAQEKNACIAVIASGGKLVEIAEAKKYPLVVLPADIQPRMAVNYNLRGLVNILENYNIVQGKYEEIAKAHSWLKQEVQKWIPDAGENENIAKQLALKIAGKTPVIYAGEIMSPVAYKWKISFNENAKNVAFCNQLPEFNHNEFIGWTSHPVEKPFAVFDLVSGFEHERTLQRFTISDKLLSGKRPKATTIELSGDSVIKQMLWGSILADFVSIYLAVLNGVDPTPVALIEKLKEELAKA
ncbi:bifunctional phosphoglucose/phosphomannose isomerase [Candidatus Saccharibacteria bacterium]|nr:bifunctional phosphoglucose/phosphomannose isomerase [Candidatus Saccharibacteria bacterium]